MFRNDGEIARILSLLTRLRVNSVAHAWQQFAHHDDFGVFGIKDNTRKVHPILPAVPGLPGPEVHDPWYVLCAEQGESSADCRNTHLRQAD